MIWLIVLIITFILFLIYGIWIEPRWFILSRFTIKVKKPLPQPMKVLHISDTHFHPRNTYINKLFDKLEKIDDLDLIVLTGDIIDNENGIDLAKHQLKRLKAHMGIYAVLGNHDHYWYGKRELVNLMFFKLLPRYKNNAEHLKATLEGIGCYVLVNEARTVSFHGTDIWIAGLDDPVTQHDEPEKLQKSGDPDQLKILLTHLLDAVYKVADHKFDLAFAGHTHGGQIRIPLLGPVVTHSRLKRKYASGLNHIDHTRVFTSRGIGTSPLIPSRFFCNPEATIFTIESK
jgi:predicted MPP superfamily phosphohydrolase